MWRHFHETHPPPRIETRNLADDVLDPGAAGIDDRARPQLIGSAPPVAVLAEVDLPQSVAPPGRSCCRTREHGGRPLLRIEGVQDHEPGIIDPTVGVFEGKPELVLDDAAFWRGAQVDASRSRKAPAAAEWS
jgi:hypothetical protein